MKFVGAELNAKHIISNTMYTELDSSRYCYTLLVQGKCIQCIKIAWLIWTGNVDGRKKDTAILLRHFIQYPNLGQVGQVTVGLLAVFNGILW